MIDPGLYFAINSPGGATGLDPASAAEFVTNLGFTISPADLQAAGIAFVAGLERGRLVYPDAFWRRDLVGVRGALLALLEGVGGPLANPRRTRL